MIDYALSVACLGGPDELDMMLDRSLRRLSPHPTRLVLFDNGRAGELERRLREQRLTTGTASGIYISAQKRRLSDESAFGRIWKDTAAQTCRFALLMTDDHVLTRSIDMNDVAYVLERQKNVIAIEFPAGRIAAKREERRGSGSVPWLVSGRLHGWPLLVRTETLRSFPWPRGGADELERGMLSALPGSSFAVWGVGDPWAKVT